VKVVLFCGGQGIRLREHSEAIPKPMVRIGYRPILWHVMRYYAHFGHRDFILCLGYRADAIKDYFLHYEEALSNDFVLSGGGREVQLLGSDIDDWRITFADTGLHATIGERLRAVRHHLAGEEIFLANYGDVLTDAPLDQIVAAHEKTEAVASLLSVPPPYSFHIVEEDGSGRVTAMTDTRRSGIRINGGGYVLRRAIFHDLDAGEDLLDGPFERLAAGGRLGAIPYDGFWVSLDTLKDLQVLQALEEAGSSPWAVWRRAVAPTNVARATVAISPPPPGQSGGPAPAARPPAVAGSVRSAEIEDPRRRRSSDPRPGRRGRAPRLHDGHPTRS
jgi:glucose-1-phosphate cytidylyltransferase